MHTSVIKAERERYKSTLVTHMSIVIFISLILTPRAFVHSSSRVTTFRQDLSVIMIRNLLFIFLFTLSSEVTPIQETKVATLGDKLVVVFSLRLHQYYCLGVRYTVMRRNFVLKFQCVGVVFIIFAPTLTLCNVLENCCYPPRAMQYAHKVDSPAIF